MFEANDVIAAHDKDWTASGMDVWQDPNDPEKMRLLPKVLAPLGPPSSVRLLDYGCGNGRMMQFFDSLGYGIRGIDISPSVLAGNRARFPGLAFELVEPGRPTPFPAAAFDAVYSSEVIEHVYDVHFLFHEFARLLRPGGLLILTTPYHGLVKNVGVALFNFERHFDVTWQHIRFWTKKSLTEVSRAHGLEPVVWKSVGRFWPVPKSFFVVCRRCAE